MSEPVDTSAEAVERLYTGNRAGSMEHRAFSTKGFRESLGYTVNPKDWVSAADYDRLQSALTAAQQRLSEQETLLAERNRECDRLREELAVLLPGLELDLRYADPDDDIDALRSRVRGVREALRPRGSAAMGAKEGM